MTKQTQSKEQSETKPEDKKVCGIVMPISAHDTCSEHHWADVKSIISEAIESAGFKPNLVSDAAETGVIQKRIVQNLYDNPVVVCDVSGKNPNVMFELGMRLAFDKPTIIIKDDKTSYSFDTQVIEHLGYPRDLRFGSIVDFKKKLAEKIKAIAKVSSEDPDHSVFLKNFGTFKVAKINQKEVTKDDYMLAQLEEMKELIARKFPEDEPLIWQPMLFDPNETRNYSKVAYEKLYLLAEDLIKEEKTRRKNKKIPLSIDEIAEYVYLKLYPIQQWSELFETSEKFYDRIRQMVEDFV